MSKIFAALFVLLMAVQVIRPLGLPGLRTRGDCWKLALAALVLFGLVALLRP